MAGSFEATENGAGVNGAGVNGESVNGAGVAPCAAASDPGYAEGRGAGRAARAGLGGLDGDDGEGLGHLARRLEAGLAIARERAHEEGVHRRRQARVDRRRHRDRIGEDVRDHRADRLALEGERARHRAEEDDRERPEIAAVIDVLRAADLLGAS